MKKITHRDYSATLESWLKTTKECLHIPSARPDLECYGTGYNSWGVQTHQKALSVFGVLSQDPQFDAANAGMSRDEVLDHALKQLRFSLETHIEGSFHCLDGTSWGHTWISCLGTERMMHAVDAMEPHLTPQDRELLKRVLISECDWLLDNYEIVGNPDASTGKNKPESNLWNGAMLHRTAMMYPQTPRTDEYREKGTHFLINSISVPSDRELDLILDGKPVSERHVGGNFTEEFGLHHHGYLNVGYMVICLSNLAMLHFAYRSRNIKAPESLYHHAYDLWKVIKMCTFPDGRLLRIGGDTRVRYCYCQDYAIPMWLFMLDHFGETDCQALETGWLSIVQKELEYNSDGSFLNKRLADLKKASPLYFTRLESDKAVTFSMGAYWRRIFDEFSSAVPAESQASSTGRWSDPFHGACLERGEKRIASWVWEASEKPQGHCLVPGGSSLAEWRTNLAGQIHGLARYNFAKTVNHREETFPGGFITCGKLNIHAEGYIAEGQNTEILAEQQIVFAALPDDTTVIGLQYAKSLHRVYLNTIKGIGLHVPNDLFNGVNRTYYHQDGELTLEGFPGKEEVVELPSNWLNIENCLSVISLYGSRNLSIHRPGRRQINIKNKPEAGGSLYTDEICAPCQIGLRDYEEDNVILDTGFIMQAGVSKDATRSYTTTYNWSVLSFPDNLEVRAVTVAGADGKHYLLVANFAEMESVVTVSLEGTEKLTSLTGDESILAESDGNTTISCAPGSAQLFRQGPR